MPEDPFDLSHWPGPPVRPAAQCHTLFTFVTNHRVRTCELRYHGEWGVEAAFLEDGNLLISRRFETYALAVQWAEAEKRTQEADEG